ncbi:Rrf2 family transcriptional regulator [Aquisalimonas lutea]|uniref:RrF2 family transcriptional regulator n=1 Tax=Aquisalimonas lutea TaxID=1327750 RepID=UPI0025B3A37E|nr:Rrf2 family transcriptional regulator [Aquisalimonas lutea]MDN3519754.1 Rrf2 family transcriptional regulator [Aquisalimonas lutea]
MELTYHTDYGLRVLMYAATHEGRRIPMREIASAYAISMEHLRKVVHHLALHGFVVTTKGRTGGLALGRAPESIWVGEVVGALESSMEIVDCERKTCALRGGCALKRSLEGARAAFLAHLNTVTLADLVGNTETFNRLSRLPVTA